jgi:hypothetical protein
MKFTLKKGTKLFLGNVPVETTEDHEFEFPNAETVDALAAELAHTPAVYGLHLAELAHEITDNRVVEGVSKLVRIAVSYGVAGTRVERILGEVEAAAEAVAEAVSPAPAPAAEAAPSSEQPAS